MKRAYLFRELKNNDSSFFGCCDQQKSQRKFSKKQERP